MAKKAKKKAVRRVKKKSLFDKIFTFPRVVILGILILSILTIYQIFLPW
jgi:hypothetical protein